MYYQLQDSEIPVGNSAMAGNQTQATGIGIPPTNNYTTESPSVCPTPTLKVSIIHGVVVLIRQL